MLGVKSFLQNAECWVLSPPYRVLSAESSLSSPPPSDNGDFNLVDALDDPGDCGAGCWGLSTRGAGYSVLSVHCSVLGVLRAKYLSSVLGAQFSVFGA